MRPADVRLGQLVTYEGQRYQLIQVAKDGDDPMARGRPRSGPDVSAPLSYFTPWKRAGTRTIRGTVPHRQGRPVVFQYDAQSGVITVRLKRARGGYTTTLEGIYDLLARQQVVNAKRDAAFKRRTRGRG